MGSRSGRKCTCGSTISSAVLSGSGLGNGLSCDDKSRFHSAVCCSMSLFFAKATYLVGASSTYDMTQLREQVKAEDERFAHVACRHAHGSLKRQTNRGEEEEGEGEEVRKNEEVWREGG